MGTNHTRVDQIEVRGIRALGVIGVLDHEKEHAQPFEVDLVIDADLRRAGDTDDLTQTVHYGVATERVVTVISTETHELIERVAQRIADEILSMERVDAVEVTIRKLRPPIPHQAEYSAVRIHRSN